MGDKQRVTQKAAPRKDSQPDRSATRAPEIHQSPVMDVPLDAQGELLELPGLSEGLTAELMMGLQRIYGNRYVQRLVSGMVMREDGDEEEEPVAHTPPADADLLIGDTYGDYILQAIANGVAAEGVVQIVSVEDARRIWGENYGTTPESMAEFDTVNGWADRSTNPPTSYVIETRGNPGTVIHEALHLYSNSAVRDQSGTTVNEGMNEYMTRQITDPLNIARDNYQDQWLQILDLSNFAGEDVLRSAYFNGETAALEAAVDGEVRPGAFLAWQIAMDAGDWEAAHDALFAPAAEEEEEAPAPAP